MPRSLRVAIVSACCLGFMGLVLAGQALADGCGRSGISRAGSAIPLLLWPVLAIWIARGLIRRDPRVRALAFGVALAGTIAIGVVTLILAIKATFIEGRNVVVLTTTFLIGCVGPFVGLVWSLSRPSAKAWFSR
jgi:hypothetical protein